MSLRGFLAHPATRGLNLDDPRATLLRRDIIAKKKFLRRIYAEWYETLRAAIPTGPGAVLELGSGAGFFSTVVPQAITSEITVFPHLRAALDGQAIPFRPGALRAIVLTDVLHHMPRPREFFTAAARCVRPGGVVAMLEPWVTTWSRLVYRFLHHEPFLPAATSWEMPASGPLSGANGALPWILFARDRRRFEAEFPSWRIVSITPTMPLRYLLSGGVSLVSLAPGWTFVPSRAAERLLQPLRWRLAMFAYIVLVRTGSSTPARVAETLE